MKRHGSSYIAATLQLHAPFNWHLVLKYEQIRLASWGVLRRVSESRVAVVGRPRHRWSMLQELQEPADSLQFRWQRRHCQTCGQTEIAGRPQQHRSCNGASCVAHVPKMDWHGDSWSHVNSSDDSDALCIALCNALHIALCSTMFHCILHFIGLQHVCPCMLCLRFHSLSFGLFVPGRNSDCDGGMALQGVKLERRFLLFWSWCRGSKGAAFLAMQTVLVYTSFCWAAETFVVLVMPLLCNISVYFLCGSLLTCWLGNFG